MLKYLGEVHKHRCVNVTSRVPYIAPVISHMVTITIKEVNL